ncbi:MAG TPA: 2-oxo-4-hydroxy-4-carboxy-5-ureidoimidazoline decarboxylase [Oceanospirillaceae bacterium]|nr:2-oxo-4-hydroxy-4-carboxy-5-ureidoimidazoline decarboxylase [Oceanospirillaceae bacterium]
MATLTTCVPSEMTRMAFVEHFKDLYEHSPWVAEGVYDNGLAVAHSQRDSLHEVFVAVMLGADQERQLALINAHPDLAGKAAIAGELTEASTSEQSGAGIQDCSTEEFAEFTQLNTAYKAKFGFPFIKAVKGSNRHQILAAFRQRIDNTPGQEFEQALVEINKIAGFRLADL